MTKLLHIATAVACLIIMQACNTSGCTDNQNALPLAGFYSSSTLQSISVTDFDIVGVGAPGDSALYSTGVALSEVYLPFRAADGQTAYLFKYLADPDNPVTDKIEFTYTAQPYFVSEECGAMYFYRITSVAHTSNLIDSIGIADSLITNVNAQQIHIYFRTE